jgi:hypothetical protein
VNDILNLTFCIWLSINLSFYLFCIDIVDHAEDTSDTEERKAAKDYLNLCEENQAEFIENTLEGLDNHITKEDLTERLKDNWFSSYKLRIALAGKTMGQTIVKDKTQQEPAKDKAKPVPSKKEEVKSPGKAKPETPAKKKDLK